MSVGSLTPCVCPAVPEDRNMTVGRLPTSPLVWFRTGVVR